MRTVIVILTLVLVASGSAAQERPLCGCYCGWKDLPSCSDDACKAACGWQEPSQGSGQQEPTAPTPESQTHRQHEAARQQEAERRDEEQQREIDEQQRRDADAAARWERRRREIVGGMRDIATRELDLKGLSTDDSTVVDLRGLGLDPDSPISVDPHVVRGQERAFSVQPDLATFENTNYISGCREMLRMDPEAALPFLREAVRERPKDPLIRNVLLLAQDLAKVQALKRAQAVQLVTKTYVALVDGHIDAARRAIADARRLDPKSQEAAALGILTNALIDQYANASSVDELLAFRLVGHAALYMARRDPAQANASLELARTLAPKNSLVGRLLEQGRSPK